MQSVCKYAQLLPGAGESTTRTPKQPPLWISGYAADWESPAANSIISIDEPLFIEFYDLHLNFIWD